ncbi:hypothetical protein RhiirA1_454906 [Rhizophagus irregularis]|uniref:Uncharacterized protein n=2 Tax=Rhizophagus irregularis TaxID=588596 RepID=A0A2I1EGZ0_9GLOM|nr:hypothetical protein GLOIN_2v1776551 [Rhizophagus irregularis DAOM 181602=DAOM 197198]PKC70339.1 hypothetical protein RhiirA1_454906 [Rhizophagus irregularis]PKY21384.1 hypothetical protein RhiirB3_434959 [Rhizophagus irregularis]POG69855.1 hypothetical protein GLOIN_2v1776551 [Rhizophagus irregularis DAOM 181602=DAOM 197198]|eukprot:XP_025176721.1 hypothetical protein GLOIN_2v1776551 [Rhizophagus irregularis DAOM 181602=DAOM 197198]
MSAMYKWSTEELISFLKSKDLRLDDEDFQVLREKKIDGVIFPNLTEERLIEYGLKRGPAMMISMEWSLLDFSNWVSSCWPSTAEDTRKTNQFFFNTLYILRDDPAVSTEVLDVVTNLLTQKKKVLFGDSCGGKISKESARKPTELLNTCNRVKKD